MALHVAQRERGFVSPEDFEELAGIFDLPFRKSSRPANFYDMFHFQKVGEYRIGVCTNVSCMLRGSEELVEHLRVKLGIGFGETSSDGKFYLFEQEMSGRLRSRAGDHH